VLRPAAEVFARYSPVLRAQYDCGTLGVVDFEVWLQSVRQEPAIAKLRDMDSIRRWRLGWIAGAALIAVVIYHLRQSPEWRHFEWKRLEFLLIHLKGRLLALALAATSASYVIRAYRWRFFVDPIKRCSFRILFAGQVLGFSSIYLVGRAGEAVRPAYIAHKEHLSFVSQLAVLVLERIYDSFALVVLLALALYFEPIRQTSGRSALLVEKAHAASGIILVLCGALAVVLAVFRIYSEPLIKWIEGLLTFVPAILRTHLIRFLRSFAAGLQVIQDPRDFVASIAATALLWILNVTVVWLDLLSLGGHLARTSWWAAGLVNILAALGLIVQLPGVGGGYQVAVVLALRDLLRVPAEAATGAAILTYMTVMVPCIALGIILAIYEGLTFRKLRGMAEMEHKELGLVPQPGGSPPSPSSSRSA
jgi:glycosyltransferase 2 family protein